MVDTILEKIYLDFLKDNPTFEITRKTSSRTTTIVISILWIGAVAFVFALVTGSLWGFVIFIGMATVIIVFNFFGKKWAPFYSDFEDLKFKYIERLLSANKNWSLTYLDQEASPLNIQEGGLLNTNVRSFRNIKVRNHINGNIEGIPVRVMEIYNEVWRPSILITFNFSLNIGTSKLTAIPSSYYLRESSGDLDIVDIIPRKAIRIKVEDQLFNKNYALYTSTVSNTALDISCVSRILSNIDKYYFKHKYKFISFHEDKVAILIFDQRIFQLEQGESLLTKNPFIRFNKELENIYSVLNFFKNEPGKK